MEKLLIGAVAGVFVGALAVELLHRKSPRTITYVEDRAARVSGLLTDGFKKGCSAVADTADQET